MNDEELVRSFYRAVEAGDEGALAQVLGAEWREIPPAYPGQPAGLAGYLPVVLAFKKAFPDVRFEIHEVLPSGDKLTVRTTIRATHRFEWLGVPASGRSVAIDTIDIHQVEGSRITCSWHIEDWYGAVRQMRGEV